MISTGTRGYILLMIRGDICYERVISTAAAKTKPPDKQVAFIGNCFLRRISKVVADNSGTLYLFPFNYILYLFKAKCK